MKLSKFTGKKLFLFLLIDLLFWSAVLIPVLIVVLLKIESKLVFGAGVIYLGFIFIFLTPMLREFCLRIYLDVKPWWNMDQLNSGSRGVISLRTPWSVTRRSPATFTTGNRSSSIFSFVPSVLFSRLQTSVSAEEAVEKSTLLLTEIGTKGPWYLRSNQVLANVILGLSAAITFVCWKFDLLVFLGILFLYCLPFIIFFYEMYLMMLFIYFVDGAAFSEKAE